MSELRCIVCDNSKHFEPLFPKLCKVKNYICLECGLVFIGSKENSYQKYYKKDGYYKQSPNKGLRQKVVNKKLMTHLGKMRFNQIQKVINFDFNGKTVLDVGCGYGQILNTLKNKYSASVVGIEPSTEISSIGREYFGIDIKDILLEELNDNAKYDFIMCNHTLEHVEDPINFLNKLKELLNENSYLYIEVPNIMVPTGNFPLDTFLYNEHLFNFSRSNIKRLLEKCGFNVVTLDDTDFIRVLAIKNASTDLNDAVVEAVDITSEEILKFLNKYKNDYGLTDYVKVYFNKFMYLLKVIRFRLI